MKPRDWLELAAGTVAFLLGMFGGFLTGFTPPAHPVNTNNGFALGFGSFLMAGLLLVIVAALRVVWRRVKPRTWLFVSIGFFVAFAIAAIVYHDYREAYSFPWPGPDGDLPMIAGDELTPAAAQIARELEESGTTATPQVLLSEFGGPRQAYDVWPEAALDRVERRMELGYLVVLLTVSAAFFFVLEGVLPLIAPAKT